MPLRKEKSNTKEKIQASYPKSYSDVLTLTTAPPKPTSNAAAASAPATVRQDTPWPGAGKMSGNLFHDRKWLLLKGYLATEGEKEEMAKPYPKEEDKMGEQDYKEKCGWGPDCPLCNAQKKEANPPHQQEPVEGQQLQKPLLKLQAIRPDTHSSGNGR